MGAKLNFVDRHPLMLRPDHRRPLAPLTRPVAFDRM
jgi:hypothetical protein